MQYSLEIPRDNIEAHLDIEKAIREQGNGIFNFVLRLNNGKVVDFSVNEYVTASKFLELKRVIITQLIIASGVIGGNQGNPLGSDVGNGTDKKWGGDGRDSVNSKVKTQEVRK